MNNTRVTTETGLKGELVAFIRVRLEENGSSEGIAIIDLGDRQGDRRFALTHLYFSFTQTVSAYWSTYDLTLQEALERFSHHVAAVVEMPREGAHS